LSDTSRVARSFAESDQRVFECLCPRCREFAELRWQHFEWTAGDPQSVRWRCPHCRDLVGEQSKAQMVRGGRWRALRPEVQGHAGFRLNALVSALAQATWPKLVAQWEAAQGDDERVKAFTNVILGEAWSEEVDGLDESALASTAEPFGVDALPKEVLAISCGVDCQDDRLECSLVGWSKDNTAFVLAHETFWGGPGDAEGWRSLDDLLRSLLLRLLREVSET